MSWEVIRVYITAMGGLLRFGLLMTWFVLVELCRVGATVWLSYWTGITESGAGHMELQQAACHAIVGLEPRTAACAVCIRQRLLMRLLDLLSCHPVMPWQLRPSR